MTNFIIELSNILRDEIDLFKGFYTLEQEKTEAIIERNGSALESISSEQKELLKSIDRLESNRADLINQYKHITWPDVVSRDITLKDVATLDEYSTYGILELGMELKKIILKMKSLQDTNEKMIKDNLEFFNITINELKKSVSIKTGYGEKGMEKNGIINPLLFNQRA